MNRKKENKLNSALKRLLPPTFSAFVYRTDKIFDGQKRQEAKLDFIKSRENDIYDATKEIEEALEEINREGTTLKNESIISLEKSLILLQEIKNGCKAISQQNEMNSQNIDKVQETSCKQFQTLIDKSQDASLKQFQILTNVLRNEISAKTIFYNADGERERYKESFSMLLDEKINIEKQFLQLIKGLDSESKAVVSKILKRMQLVLSSEASKMNILSVEEQNEVKYITQHIKTCILELSESLFSYNGYLLPYNYFDLSVFYYRHGLDSVPNIDRIGNKAIIDAGAFIGDSALVLSSYTDQNVYSFEAVPENYSNLVKTIELNGVKNVIPVNKAIGSKTEKAQLNIGEKVWCSSIKEDAKGNYSNKVEIEMIKLDDFVQENNLNIGLIKADIEGAEQDLINGAVKTIKEQQPLIIISIYHSADDFFNIKPMLEALVPEYRFIIHKPMPNVVLLETSLIAIPPSLLRD